MKLYKPWGWVLGSGLYLDDVQADVSEDQVPDVLAELALLVDLHRRDAQRLLPHLDGVGVVAAGDGAACPRSSPSPGSRFSAKGE